MNKDAKIGLFAVLILVVLVTVMWAKLAGNKNEAPPTPTETASTEQATSENAGSITPLIVANNNTTPPADGYRAAPNPFANTSTPPGTASTPGSKPPVTPPAGTDPKAIGELFPPGEKPKTGTNDLAVDPVTETPNSGTVAAEWPKQHVVAKGETLSVIAKKYSTSWKAIADANKDILPDLAKMKIGLKLQVPEPARKSELTPVTPEDARKELAQDTRHEIGKTDTTVSETPKAGSKYIVKKGDTLISIARNVYGKAGEWKAILNANKDKLPSADRLRTGMVLTIPEKP